MAWPESCRCSHTSVLVGELAKFIEWSHLGLAFASIWTSPCAGLGTIVFCINVCCSSTRSVNRYVCQIIIINK
jgi:hypothetical protein